MLIGSAAIASPLLFNAASSRECPVSVISETEIGASYYEKKKRTATKVMEEPR